MHTLKRFVTQNAGRNLRFKFRVGLTGALLLMMAVVVAACSSSDPTATPPPAPADTAVPEVSVTPAVQVADQELVEDTVTVASVVSAGPGWIVIHADNDGAPGPILGYAPVQDGENSDVIVELAADGRTETLYAMLHTDAGAIGTYEFPGEDGPVQVDGSVVTPAFQVTGGLAMITPAVQVADQALVEDTVTVASVVSAGPGWIVIHADNDGAPGPILGYAPVQDGENSDVVVELNLVGLTGTLRAMLHTDAGQLGTFEFPGEDGPVTYGDGIVISPFDLRIAEGDAVDVSLQDFSFSPALLIVRAGATVTWTNNDGNVIHTTTSDDGVWDSGALNGGDAFSFAFDEPGTYRYYCQPHGGPGGEGMSGIIVVVPDATETAAASG
jgi:plastocyanin